MMKSITLLALMSFWLPDANAQRRAVVGKDSAFSVKAKLDDRYSMYGYAAPDIKSEVVILFSSYPTEVSARKEQNRLGAYHETIGLKEGDRISYESGDKNFIRLIYQSPNKPDFPFYVRARNVKFE